MKPKFFINDRCRRSGATLATAMFVCLSGGAMAQTQNLWTGSVSTAWNVDGNWSLGAVPTKAANQHAVINTNTGNIATISLGAIPPADIIVGIGAGTNGLLNHNGGDAATGSANWMYVGTDGGTGVYNLADVSGTGGTHTGFAMGSGSMTASGRLYIGGFNAAGSNGTVNVNTTGILTVGAELNVSASGGTGVLNLDNGAVNVNGPIRIGYQTGGNGTLNMSGGSITKTGADVLVVAGNGSTGLANVSGGAISVNGETWVGNGSAAGTSGTFNLTGGTLTANSWLTIGRGGATGVLNLDGGTIYKQTSNSMIVGARDGGASNGTVNHLSGDLIMTNGAQLWIGQNANAATGKSTGTYNLSDGTISLNSWLAIGREGGNGTLNMTGGVITKTGSGSNFIIGTSGSGTGTMNMSGGLVTVEPSATANRGITWVGESSTGIFNMSGTAEFDTARLTLGDQASGSGTVQFNGGTLVVGQITGGAGTAAFHFNGGQIIASSASTAFIDNLDTAEIQSGGLLLDDAGLDLAIPQPLGGSGGLEKDGFGTLTLTGANTYSGATLINDGGLSLTTDTAVGSSLTMADFTVLGVSQTAIDGSITIPDLTFDGDVELDIDLGDHPGITANAPLDITNTATLNGIVTVNVSDTAAEVGTVPLVTYGTETSADFELGSLPDGVAATLDDGTLIANTVSLVVTRVNDAYWTGAIDNVWDTSTANWVDDHTETVSTYQDGDPVLFDDRVGGGPTNVVLNTTVSPGGSGVTFDNSTYDYVLGGIGKIAGNSGLEKLGTGTATVTLANEYLGATTLTAGTLSVSTLADGGAPSPIGMSSATEENLVFNGGTLYYTGSSTTVDRSFLTTGPGGGIGTDNDLTITGSAYSDGGTFVKSGPGNLTFTYDGTNTFGTPGDTGLNVLGGTLTLDGTSVTQSNAVTGGLRIGYDPGVSAHAVFTNTSVSCSEFLTVGRGNGDGAVSTLTATNSTITSGGFASGFNDGLANNDSDQIITLDNTQWTNNGILILGENTGADTTLTLTNGSSIDTSGGALLLGRFGTAAATVTITDSTLTKTGNYTSIGANGVGTMNIGGNSVVTADGDFNVGDVGTSQGFLNISGTAALNASGTFFVGKGATTQGTLDITGGTINGGLGTIARDNGSIGTITQSGGTVVFGADDRLWMGNNGDATWTQTGGDTTCNGYLVIGRGATSEASWDISAGTLTQNPPNPGEYPGVILAEAGIGTITVSGTGVFDSTGGQINLATSGGNGTLNLNAGGTVRANQIVEFNVGTSAVNFDGGTLVANANANPDFLTGIDTTTVHSGGVTIDSNGKDIAANVAMLEGSGGGGLTKTGAGTLYLNGANTYTGTTTVSAGALGGTGSIAGPLVVDAAASVAPGASVGTLTTGDADIAGTYICEIDGATADVLAVNGDLDIDGADISVLATAPTGTEWIIATYTGNLTGTIGSVTSGYTLDTGTSGVVKLVSSGTPYSLWAASKSLSTGVNDGPTQDPEFDGIENVLEFVLGGNPLASDTTILPTLDASGANFVFSFDRSDESEAEVSLLFQYGSDLAGWTDVIIGADNGSSGPEVGIVEDGANPDQITVTVPKSGTEMFGRLRAVK